MTIKDFEKICKNLLAAGFYLVEMHGPFYDLRKIVSYKTILSPADIRVYHYFDSEQLSYTNYKVKPNTILLSTNQFNVSYYVNNITNKQTADMLSDNYSNIGIAARLNDKYSLVFSVNEEENIPEDNGYFYIIEDSTHKIIDFSGNYYTGQNLQTHASTWQNFYALINKFFISKDLISFVNSIIPNCII